MAGIKADLKEFLKTPQRMQRFVGVLLDKFPGLVCLCGLLEDKMPEFLNEYEGQTITVPSKAQLRELAVDIDICATTRELGLRRAMPLLQERYGITGKQVLVSIAKTGAIWENVSERTE